jgi:hypothetical protein
MARLRSPRHHSRGCRPLSVGRFSSRAAAANLTARKARIRCPGLRRHTGGVNRASKILYRDPPTSAKLPRVNLWVTRQRYVIIQCYHELIFAEMAERAGFEPAVPRERDYDF